jgi:monofunctional glycosyltransferase
MAGVSRLIAALNGQLRTRRRRVLFWVLLPFACALVGDAVYLAIVWPDWAVLKDGPVPRSHFIANYEARQRADKRLPKLNWQPVPMSSLPLDLQHAVIVGEDADFYRHGGVDLQAIRDAVDYNMSRGKVAVGASTISQQTVKNLFLSGARTPIRKWHELILTWAMERNLSKSRILTLYLNIAQFGEGIFGAEAAARTYFGGHARSLTLDQCVALAATLPGPTHHNPSTATEFFTRRKQRIYAFLEERAWAPPAAGSADSQQPAANTGDPARTTSDTTLEDE